MLEAGTTMHRATVVSLIQITISELTFAEGNT